VTLTLTPYTGYSPMNVAKDAKYRVTANGEIRLEFRESARVRYLLTTDKHPRLVEMVNAVKLELTGQPGGAFYLNEFQHVLVPDGRGGSCFWSGSYDGTLEFHNGSQVVSPNAPVDLRPGDRWPGPHVGIKYVLAADTNDVRYEKVDGRRAETFFLSDDVGPSAASRLARRIATVKGSSGGGFYINERQELFAPVGTVAAGYTYLYIGHLGEDRWFDSPVGYGAH
jgi:hypothetical protein